MDFFTTFIYQPFFNILVGLYWLTGEMLGDPDMGIAVIFFAVAVRLILLPADLLAERSDEDKFRISEKINLIKKEFADSPEGKKRRRERS